MQFSIIDKVPFFGRFLFPVKKIQFANFKSWGEGDDYWSRVNKMRYNDKNRIWRE